MASHITKIVNANPYKNDGATVLLGGNAVTTGQRPNISYNLTLQTNAYDTQYGSHPVLAVSPNSSGNLGTTKILSGGVFGKLTEGNYTIRGLPTTLAGAVSSSVLVSGASDWGVRKPIPKLETTRALGVNSWDYVTGAITKGGTAGDSVSFGNDTAARPTNAVPGKLVYFTGNPVPVSANYAAKYSY